MSNEMVVSYVYTVVVLHVQDGAEPGESPTVSRRRTWGWYRKFEDAERAVLENQTDIFECGYYNVGLIELVSEGVMAMVQDRWWFRGEFVGGPGNLTRVERTEEPGWAEQIVNFSMG